MTLPSRDSISTYGGGVPGAGYNDYSPVIDPTTDVPAAGLNQALSNIAMLTRTTPRCMARWEPLGTGTPTLLTHMALWGNSVGVAPVVAYGGSTGLYTITWPFTVTDDLTVSTAPGYVGPQALNLIQAHGQCESITVIYHVQCVAVANVVYFSVWLPNTGALVSPNATANFSVWGY